jgi:DNA-binding HxlR family transcriptional regulator
MILIFLFNAVKLAIVSLQLIWVSFWKVVSFMKLCEIAIPLQHKFVARINHHEMKKKVTETHSDCSKELLAIKDTMDIMSGKWKIHIIATLTYKGAVRFMDLLRLVDGIGAKMLSKELHDLEVNLLVKRTVLDTKPVTVEYELTPHGKTLERTINEIHLWGKSHRKKIIGK